MEPAGKMTGAKLLKTWWPGTELNRRRQPFQGCIPPSVSGDSATSKHERVSFFSPSFWNHNGTNQHITVGRRGLPQPLLVIRVHAVFPLPNSRPGLSRWRGG